MITTKKKEMIEILSKLKPGLAKREIIEEMVHFTFTGDRVLTYNEEVCISYPFETDFQCSVNAKDMLDALNKAKAETIELDLVEGQLNLTCKDQDVFMNVSQETEIKDKAVEVISEAADDVWKKVPEDFTECMFLTMFSASKQEADGSFQGICVDNVNTYSTDRLRVTRCTMKSPMDPFVIRAAVAQDLRNYKFTEYNQGDNWINFRTADQVLFSVKKIADDWPVEDMQQHLKLEGTRFRLPESLQVAAHDLITWTEGDMDFHKTVSFIMENNLITLEGKKESGIMRKRVLIEYQSDPIKFLISPVYLSTIMDKGATRIVVGETRAAFKKENMLHIMQLQAK